jgi:hypothetical protein
MRRAIFPIAAATALLVLAACGKNDDGVMSPEAVPPVEQTTPADTPPEPEPAPPADDTMTPPPSDETMPPDTTMSPPVDTPTDPENPDTPTDSTAPPAG